MDVQAETCVPPPIPLLHHGPLLSDGDFEVAYRSFDEYILEALDDDSKPLGHAISQLTPLCPMDDNGAHIKLDSVGAEHDFYRT